MKKYFLLFVLFTVSFSVFSQMDSLVPAGPAPKKLVIFAPLHLDSAFTADGSPRWSGLNFPKYLLPGLEFVNGAQMAFDSLKAMKKGMEIFIIDLKQKYKSLNFQLSELQAVDMIIVSATTPEELKAIADYGLQKNIPVISATYPNDGNVNKNPNFYVLNTTLRGHCEAIYKYIQKSYTGSTIVLIRKPGKTEDRIKQVFEALSKQGTPTKLKTIEVGEEVSAELLKQYLDSTGKNICVVGSLDEKFGKSIISSLSTLKKDSINGVVFGMPNWDDVNFSKEEYKGVDIFYTTPYHFNRSGGLAARVADLYNARKHSRASDMVFKGFEATLRFGRALLSGGVDGIAVTDKKYKVFNDFDLMPVRFSKNSSGPDYYENKKVFFVKKRDGVLLGMY
jgi:hypothetical protein